MLSTSGWLKQVHIAAGTCIKRARDLIGFIAAWREELKITCSLTIIEMLPTIHARSSCALKMVVFQHRSFRKDGMAQVPGGNECWDNRHDCFIQP